MPLTKDEIRTLLSDIENECVARTLSTDNTKKISEAICSFANDIRNTNKPGYFLIGADDNGNPAEFLLGDYTTFKVVVQNADVIENGTDSGTDGISREDAIVYLMRKNKRKSIKEISSQLNIPRRTLFRIIDTLKSDERIRRVGSEKSGTWEVIE